MEPEERCAGGMQKPSAWMHEPKAVESHEATRGHLYTQGGAMSR
jgi:hypothetical protein